MIQEKIVLVTDKTLKKTTADISDRNLEGNEVSSTERISEAIKSNVRDFELYTGIQNFIDDIGRHKNDLIFPMKYGRNTPNSKSMLPGICEGANLRYIGADDYAHIICNDKYMAKLFARQFGIQTAPCVLLRNFSNPETLQKNIQLLKFPVVVKPNFGGGSTGISENNVCFTCKEAYELAYALFTYHQMPILVEEYISGQEVELILVGNKNQIKFSEEVQLIMSGEESFESEIWGFETKKIDDSNIDFKTSSFISKRERTNIHCLFQAFDKIEFMRVDGRFHNGIFYLIELSPDCYLGDDCAFYFAFKEKGYSLSDMFEYLIINGLEHYQ